MPLDHFPLELSGLFPFADSGVVGNSEKLLAAYFNTATVGLAILDAELRYIAVNKTLAHMHHLPAAEHAGKSIREVLGDFADIVEPRLRRVLATGEPVQSEDSGKLPLRDQEGHWIAHFIPIHDATGAVTRIGVVVVEITAQKLLEQSLVSVTAQLREEMKRLQMLLDVGGLLSSNWDLTKAFPQISARIRRVLSHEFASLALYDPGNGLLIRQSLDFPLGRGFAEHAQVGVVDSPSGKALQTRTPMIFTGEQLAAFEDHLAHAFVSEGIQSLCCMPLLRPHGPLGVFVLGSTRKEAFKSVDLDLLNQVATQLAIAIENHHASREIEALKQRLGEEKKYLEGEIRFESHFSEIVGDSPALKQVLAQVTTVAPSGATVLILGETGTGKELVARAIHRLSHCKDGPFIKVNCAAIPTGLLESELFGHEKGAFTGAISQKIGRMELADGGTLFLDEVGEIPLELQPKLLRVLQDQEFERLGANRTIKVNLRLVAATNRDLAQDIAAHQFRRDLFYRLSVFPIRMPPLRERPEDIPLLVRHFVRKFATRMGRFIETIPKPSMRALTEWHWPGNVRELENLIERSVILSEGPVLRIPVSELKLETYSVVPPNPDSADRTLQSAERDHIIRILRETHGILSGPDGAARRLGLKRTTLQSKMHRLKISRADYSDS